MSQNKIRLRSFFAAFKLLSTYEEIENMREFKLRDMGLSS